MAIGSMNVSNNSKINDEIKSLHDKDTEIETTLNTKANNDDIAIRSISDTSIQLTDAKDANMLLDHAPINMLNITITSKPVYGLTITVNPDKSIYVKGTATAHIEIAIGNFNVIKGQTFSFGQAKSITGWVGGDGTSWDNYMYFNKHDGTTSWRADGTHTATVTTTVHCVLYVKKGKTVDCTYYPRVYYENKRHYYVPPEGYEIISCGKNLVDVSEISTWDSLNNSIYCQKILKVKPNTKYTISQLTDRFADNMNKAWIFIKSGSHTDYSIDWTWTGKNGCIVDTPITITSDSEGWITVGSLNTITTDIQIQLEEGDTATTYEPFNGKKVTIDKSTVFPLEGLKSLNGLTNIYNSYGVPMEVSYATNASGQSIMNKITNITNIINDKTGSTDISSIGDGTITGAIAALKEQIDAL